MRHPFRTFFQACVIKKIIKVGVVVLTYHSTDAASTDGGLELAVQFFDGAGCVKALGKQNDSIQEEK